MSSSSSPERVVNKRELAKLLRTTVVSLGNWIEKWPDLPVLERGTNGREWQFEASAVVEFLRAKQEEGRAAKAERDEALSQLVLPLALTGDAEKPLAGSIKEQREALLFRIAQRQEAEKLGRLVAADDVRDALTTAFGTMNRVLTGAVKAIGQDHSLPPGVLRVIQARIATAQREAVREIAKQLAGTELGDELDLEPERALA